MGGAWWNLTLRFALELAALFGIGLAGRRLVPSPWNWGAVIALPLLAAALWGVFNVPDDPSRSGNAPVKVPGAVRLIIELIVLLGGAGCIVASGYPMAGRAMATLIIVHYVLSWDRIRWLLRN